jgi:putative glutamine amidotransferase
LKYDSIIYSIVSDNNVPYLGICGGMQLMRNDGVEYVPNKPNETEEHMVEGTGYAHKINIVAGSRLQSILEQEIILVNSKHTMHIPDSGNKSVGAYAPDGIIEALENRDKLFNIGVQWHPELMPTDENNQKLLNAFIESARQYKKENHKRVF